MKKIGRGRFAALLCASILFATGASAAPVTYEGTLTAGVSATGTVPTGDGWINNQGGEVDYWRFFSIGGQSVEITVHPLSSLFDPAFSIYLGTTTADTSGFNNFGDWGGMTFIDFGATPTGNGGEDATWTFPTTAQTAFYTVAVGGWNSAGPGPFRYEITVTGNVPEPMTAALLAIGLAGIVVSRRRQFATASLSR